MGVRVTAVHRPNLCGISHSGGLVLTDVGKEEAWSGRGLFVFLVLRALRFPPVLTWRGFTIVPKELQAEIPAPLSSFFLFLHEGWGLQLLWSICQAASWRGRTNWWFMGTSAGCKALEMISIKRRRSVGLLWSPCWYSHWRRRTWARLHHREREFSNLVLQADSGRDGQKAGAAPWIWRRRSAGWEHFCDV